MKAWFYSLLLVLTVSSIHAQDKCRPFLPVGVGSTWELTNYNAKGKETGRIAYELSNKVESEAGTTFSITAISFDAKDKQTYENSFEAFCADGIFKYDMTFMMSGEQMQAFESMEISVDATEFELPDFDASAGTSLPDGSLSVKAETGGPISMDMTVLVTDRRVESKESMDCPAGKFECIVLKQKTSLKMVVKLETQSKEWYAEGVGVVRSETYSKKGKLQAYSLLTKFNPG